MPKRSHILGEGRRERLKKGWRLPAGGGGFDVGQAWSVCQIRLKKKETEPGNQMPPHLPSFSWHQICCHNLGASSFLCPQPEGAELVATTESWECERRGPFAAKAGGAGCEVWWTDIPNLGWRCNARLFRELDARHGSNQVSFSSWDLKLLLKNKSY